MITLYSNYHPIKVLDKSLKRDSRGISYRIVVECEGLAPRFMCIKITKDRRGQSQVEGTVKRTSQNQAKRACGFEKAIQKEKKIDKKEKKVELQKVDDKEKKDELQKVDEKEKKVELQKVDEKEKKIDEKEKKVELQKVDEMEKKDKNKKEKKVEFQKLHEKEKKDELYKEYQKENDNGNYGNHYGHYSHNN